MKLTLAFGLQYDSRNPAAAMAGTQLAAQEERAPPLSEPVIDTVATVIEERPVEFSYRYGIYFLTYNLQGAPEAIEEIGKVDMFA